MNTSSPNLIHRPCPDLAGFVMSSEKVKASRIKVCELRLSLLREKYKDETRDYVKRSIEKQANALTTTIAELQKQTLC